MSQASIINEIEQETGQTAAFGPDGELRIDGQTLEEIAVAQGLTPEAYAFGADVIWAIAQTSLSRNEVVMVVDAFARTIEDDTFVKIAKIPPVVEDAMEFARELQSEGVSTEEIAKLVEVYSVGFAVGLIAMGTLGKSREWAADFSNEFASHYEEVIFDDGDDNPDASMN